MDIYSFVLSPVQVYPSGSVNLTLASQLSVSIPFYFSQDQHLSIPLVALSYIHKVRKAKDI